MNKNNNATISETWNLPISEEEYEEILMIESVMDMEETMRLIYEAEMMQSEEIRMMQRPIGHYADDRDYFRDYEENLADYRY